MIPDGWTRLPLASVVKSKIAYGIVQAGPHDPVGIPYLKSSDIGGEIDIDSLQRTAPTIHQKYRRSAVHPGDIVISLRGNTGVMSVVPDNLPLANLTQGTARISVADAFDKRFVFQQISSDQTQRLINAATKGSTFVEITLEDLRKIEIVLPKVKSEQRRIATVLDAWKEAITTAGKLVAVKERRLDWLRANLLTGKVRLPSFAKPWQTVTLENVLIEHGQTSTGREEVHSVSVHLGLINQIEHLGRSFAAANTDHYNRVLPGDIVYTKSPTGDFPLGIIKQSRLDKAAIVSPLYGVFTPASRELGTIMDTLFASSAAAERLLAPVVQKGAKNTIAVTNRNFLKAQLRLPIDQREIVALSELVEAARAELDVHKAELKLLHNQKRGLMQKLLTGQWRVPESIGALMPEVSEVSA